MKYTLYTWACPCGQCIKNPQVGVGSNHMLVAVWRCPKCRKSVNSEISFAELEIEAQGLADNAMTRLSLRLDQSNISVSQAIL